jgi:hypothetical protein
VGDIPNLQQIDPWTFSEERISKRHTILRSIHDVEVDHDDPYPHNVSDRYGPGSLDRFQLNTKVSRDFDGTGKKAEIDER